MWLICARRLFSDRNSIGKGRGALGHGSGGWIVPFSNVGVLWEVLSLSVIYLSALWHGPHWDGSGSTGQCCSITAVSVSAVAKKSVRGDELMQLSIHCLKSKPAGEVHRPEQMPRLERAPADPVSMISDPSTIMKYVRVVQQCSGTVVLLFSLPEFDETYSTSG